ncbi:MAG: STAS domain-containing protein [Acidobacteriota bacterium]
MQVTRSESGGGLDVTVDGRIDGYWADHLDTALVQAVREGHHRIAVECSKVSFLSSAGIGILAKHYKELTRIGGTFQVVNPSKAVATVLQITKLADLLIAPLQPAVAEAGVPSRRPRRTESDGLGLDVFDLEADAVLTCRPIGTPASLANRSFDDGRCVSLGGTTPAFVVGAGAFGAGFTECRARFGELLSVAGATAYQPADGTNVPDYLVARGPLGFDVHVLYGIAGDGAFSHLVRFEPLQRGGTVALSQLAGVCLEVAGADCIGLVIIAETAGLVGAALRRSPAERVVGGDFFSHPSVRTRLTFTAERAFTHSVTLAAGIVSTQADGPLADELRPLGAAVAGHLHAAAFDFRPIQKGCIDLHDTVERLFEPDRLTGVLHLLNDDRHLVGAGESEFVRGACWIGRIG